MMTGNAVSKTWSPSYSNMASRASVSSICFSVYWESTKSRIIRIGSQRSLDGSYSRVTRSPYLKLFRLTIFPSEITVCTLFSNIWISRLPSLSFFSKWPCFSPALYYCRILVPFAKTWRTCPSSLSCFLANEHAVKLLDPKERKVQAYVQS